MIKNRKASTILLGAMIVVIVDSCIESFEAKTEVFEDTLVIDALLTDESKQHRVILTRAFRFEDNTPVFERNANVEVVDDEDVVYLFQETEPGVYLSQVEFAAAQGKNYTLKVRTSDGKSYVSKTVRTPVNVPITELMAERLVNDMGEEGVSILLDNETISTEPTYFRFEYEETYQIIAPKYDPFEFEVIDYVPCDGDFYEVAIKPRIVEQKTCFGSVRSSGLIQASTTGLEGNKVDNFNIRFINRNNYIISHRYSILVRQYTQTQGAHSYYEQLGDFSSSDNVFSQIQPGFLTGNLRSETNADEKVLGYFEVASLSEVRLYFNYSDLFPNEPLPPYAVDCETLGNPLLVGRGYHCDGNGNCDGACESPLIEGILAGILVFNSVNENPTSEMPGPFFTLPSPCGDCTKLGSNVVPEYWLN
ncbi:MAG: DUF4249 domain-containing protein [Maribacter sp.]|nr:DUF4249 domain-containing protein [Maribacter sp.]